MADEQVEKKKISPFTLVLVVALGLAAGLWAWRYQHPDRASSPPPEAVGLGAAIDEAEPVSPTVAVSPTDAAPAVSPTAAPAAATPAAP